ncbi:replication initiation protein [Acinetobacter baumannii]|nr:replication initiation protein [Acinetobacter baumannii]
MLFEKISAKESKTNELQVISGRAKPNDLVVTRNDFPLSSYSIDLNLEKLMYCAMVIVRKTELQNNHEFNPNDIIIVSAQNFGELTSKQAQNNPNIEAKELKEIERNAEIALKRIYKRFDNPIMLIKTPDEPDPVKVPMMTRCHYSSKKKSIEVRFAAEFYEYFYNLVKWTDDTSPSFSSHELKQVVLLESKYGVRLYNFLNSLIWRTKEIEVNLDDLRWRFQCVDLYTELYNFKKRVLDAACEDINSNTNLEVSYENIKDGKEVTGIKFFFDYKKDYKLTVAEQSIQKMKELYLKNAVPYSDDGSHFKANDRHKYFTAPKSLSSKQISVLVNCSEFLSDYGHFLGNSDFDTARKVMRNLLSEKLEAINTFKAIDLDYYFWLQNKKGALKSNGNESE